MMSADVAAGQSREVGPDDGHQIGARRFVETPKALAAELVELVLPTLLPALIVSTLALVAPFFVMQPGLGAGIAGSKTPNPNAVRLRSVLAHTVFGIGLYVAALLSALLIPA